MKRGNATLTLDEYDQLMKDRDALAQVTQGIKDKKLILCYKEQKGFERLITHLYFDDTDRVIKDIMESLYKEQQKVIDLNKKVGEIMKENENLVELKIKNEKFVSEYQETFKNISSENKNWMQKIYEKYFE